MFYIWVEKKDCEIIIEWLIKHGVKRINYQESGDFLKIPIEVRTPKNFDKSKIWQLRQEDKTYDEIAKEIGCSKSYARKVINEKIQELSSRKKRKNVAPKYFFDKTQMSVVDKKGNLLLDKDGNKIAYSVDAINGQIRVNDEPVYEMGGKTLAFLK